MATGYKADVDGTITIGTSVDVGGIDTGLTHIKTSFSKLNSIMNTSNNTMKRFTNSSTGLSNSLGFLVSRVKSLIGIYGLGRLGATALNAASDLQEIQNVVDVSFRSLDEFGNVVEDDTYKIENFSKSCIEMYGMSELTSKETAGAFAAMGKSMGLTLDEATSMSVKLTGLTGDFASFYNISQKYAKTALSAVYTGETETLKRYGIVLTEANLQQFAQSKGIEENVKKMSARNKLLLRYMYVMEATKDMEGDFLRTQDTWANQLRVLKERWKQFLIVLGNGLMTVLNPLLRSINAITSKLTEFAKVLGQILIKLFGIKLNDVDEVSGSIADNIGDAAENEEDLAEATDAAAKAANKALGAYDKLNVIQKKQSSSGSSDDSDVGFDIDWDAMADDANVVDSVVAKIKADVNTFYELGLFISDKIQTILDKIPWGEIYNTTAKFATNFADFLNGLISPELFSKVGETLGNAFNVGVIEKLSFYVRFNWEEFGNSIAAGINTFFNTFNFENLALSVAYFANGVFDTLNAAFKNIDWKNLSGSIVSGINTVFETIEPDKLGDALIELIGGVVNSITTLYNDFNFKAIFDAINKFVTSIATGLDNLFDFGGIVKGVGDAFSSIDFSGFIEQLKNFIDAITPFVKGFTKGFVESFSIFAEAILSIANIGLKGISAFFELLTKILKQIDPTVLEVLGKALGSLMTALIGYSIFTKASAAISAFFTVFKAVSPMLQGSSGIISSLGLLANAIKQLCKKDFVTGLSSLKAGFEGLLNTLADNAVIAVVTGLTMFVSGMKGLINAWGDSFDRMVEIPKVSEEVANALERTNDLIKSTEDAVETAGASYAAVETVADKYFALVEKGNDLTEVERRMMKIYAEQIVEQCPELKDSIDTVTGAFTGQKEEVYKTIESLKLYAQAAAMKDVLQDLYEQQVKLDLELQEQQGTYEDYALKVLGIVDSLSFLSDTDKQGVKNMIMNMGDLERAMSLIDGKIGSSKDNLNEFNSAMGVSAEQVSQVATDYVNLADSSKKVGKYIDITTRKTVDYTLAAEGNSEALERLEENNYQVSESVENSLDILKQKGSEFKGSFLVWGNEITNIQKTDAEKFLTTANTATTKFGNIFTGAMNTISDGLKQIPEDATTSATDATGNFVNILEQGAMKDATKNQVDKVELEFGKSATIGNNAGADLGSGFNSGLTNANMADKVNSQLNSIAENNNGVSTGTVIGSMISDGIFSALSYGLNNNELDLKSNIFGSTIGSVLKINAKVPGLAKGAVIPPNKQFMAILGDQTSGTNIETPLSTMIDAFNTALDGRGATSSGPDVINLEFDGNTFIRWIRQKNEEYKRMTGMPITG